MKYLILPEFQSWRTILATISRLGAPPYITKSISKNEGKIHVLFQSTFLILPFAMAMLQRNSVIFLKSLILYSKSKSFFGIFLRISSTGGIGSSIDSGLIIFLSIVELLQFSSSKITPGQSITLTLLSIVTS